MPAYHEKLSYKKILSGVILFIFIVVFFIFKLSAIEKSNESTFEEIAKRVFMEEQIKLIKNKRIYP